MKINWYCLLAGMVICFSFVLATPVYAADKHVSDCLDGDGDCLEELENTDREDAPAGEKIEQQPLSSGNTFITIVKMVVALLLVLALIYFLLFLVKRKNNLFQQAGVIENMGGTSVGQQKSVQIIRIGEAIYLIGVGENVELLSEIKDETVLQQLLEQQAEKENAPSFLETILPKKKSKQSNEQKMPFTTALQQELKKLQKQRHHISDTTREEEDRNE